MAQSHQWEATLIGKKSRERRTVVWAGHRGLMEEAGPLVDTASRQIENTREGPRAESPGDGAEGLSSLYNGDVSPILQAPAQLYLSRLPGPGPGPGFPLSVCPRYSGYSFSPGLTHLYFPKIKVTPILFYLHI